MKALWKRLRSSTLLSATSGVPPGSPLYTVSEPALSAQEFAWRAEGGGWPTSTSEFICIWILAVCDKLFSHFRKSISLLPCTSSLDGDSDPGCLPPRDWLPPSPSELQFWVRACVLSVVSYCLWQRYCHAAIASGYSLWLINYSPQLVFLTCLPFLRLQGASSLLYIKLTPHKKFEENIYC